MELLRSSISLGMEFLDHFCARSSYTFLHLNLTQELLTDGLKGIWGPFREPIDCGTVDNGGEISDSVSEGITNWGEAQDDV